MITLQQFIGDQLYIWLMVFARIGTAFSILPTVGDAFISTRTRLLLALAVAVLVTPVSAQFIPPMPPQVFSFFVLLLGEMAVGIFIGAVARLLMGALEVAGTIIALQSGLANAQIFNPSLAASGSLPGSLLAWLALLLMYATDLHHLLIRAVVESYDAFPPGAAIPIDDMAYMVAQLVGRSFKIGAQMAAPFIISGILFALALGLVNRMAPQLQVFMVFTSLQVALGLFMLALTLSAMMMFWLGNFESTFIDFLR